MANESESNAPQTDREWKPPLVPRPSSSVGTQQNNKIGTDGSAAARREEAPTTKLERDIETGEIALIVINGLLLITTVVIAIIYTGQLKEMRKATAASEKAADAAASAADTADKTLKEIRAGSTDTHELAVQAKNQADRTREIADRALAQANATNDLVRVAKRSLVASDRPWVGLVGLDIKPPDSYYTCPITRWRATFINVGHSPALEATTQMEERFFDADGFPDRPPYTADSPPNNKQDKMTIVPGIPVPNQGAVCLAIKHGDESVDNFFRVLYIYGNIEYKDNGGGYHHTYFCQYRIRNNPELAACPKYNGAD